MPPFSIGRKVGQVRFTPKEGEMSLDEYVVHPNHRVQGVLIAHKGKIVYEAYPGMNQDDRHIWMSAGKTTVGLIFALLEAEGKVDVQKQVVDYVSELKGTNWDGITVLNALNMALGLQLEETLEAIVDPGRSSCASSAPSSANRRRVRPRLSTGWTFWWGQRRSRAKNRARTCVTARPQRRSDSTWPS